MVLAKCESDPVVPVSTAFLLYSLDIPLFLEYFGVLGHVLGRRKGIKVSDIGFAIQHGNERCGKRTERSKGDVGEEWEGLDIRERVDAILGMGDESERSCQNRSLHFIREKGC